MDEINQLMIFENMDEKIIIEFPSTWPITYVELILFKINFIEYN
jgi:hypothetical protein